MKAVLLCYKIDTHTILWRVFSLGLCYVSTYIHKYSKSMATCHLEENELEIVKSFNKNMSSTLKKITNSSLHNLFTVLQITYKLFTIYYRINCRKYLRNKRIQKETIIIYFYQWLLFIWCLLFIYILKLNRFKLF